MSDSLLRVEDLSVSYQGRQVLDRISLEVRQGELLSIVGPSGCGKSTLLNAVSGLLAAEATSSGRIELAPSARLGYLFQRDALLPWYTVLRNVEIGAELRGFSAGERREVAQRWLEAVHLHGVDSHYPGQLSGGMRQRVSLARVLAYDPELILLDEPFVALDLFTRMSLQDQLLETWRTTGKTMIIVTHDPEEALALGTRILVFERHPGRVHAQFELDWPRDRTVEHLRTTDAFLEKSRTLWDVLLEVGAAGAAPRGDEPSEIGAAVA